MVFGGVPLVHVLRRDLNAVFRGSERTGRPRAAQCGFVRH